MEQKVRSSNFELFRIILMIFIIAHHYVVNSGLTTLINVQSLDWNILFLQFWGFGGKIAINCFILITGFFMIKGGWRRRKAITLYAEIKFYKILIFLALSVGIYNQPNFNSVVHCIFSVFYAMGYGRSFPEVFLLFYLFVPLINKMLNALNKKEWKYLILLLLFYYSVTYTLIPSLNFKSIHYLGWFMTLYIIGGYIRMFPNKYTESPKLSFYSSISALVFIFLSILIIDVLISWQIVPRGHYYYFAMDSNKLSAVWLSVSIFLYVKTHKIQYNRYINWAAKSTLGILLIHANSDLMRRFLWRDLLNVVGFYKSYPELILIHAVVSVIGIYLVCLFLDKGREYFFTKCEKYFMALKEKGL